MSPPRFIYPKSPILPIRHPIARRSPQAIPQRQGPKQERARVEDAGVGRQMEPCERVDTFFRMLLHLLEGGLDGGEGIEGDGAKGEPLHVREENPADQPKQGAELWHEEEAEKFSSLSAVHGIQ